MQKWPNSRKIDWKIEFLRSEIEFFGWKIEFLDFLANRVFAQTPKKKAWCNSRGSKTLETALPDKPTPSGFRAKNYKIRLGWNAIIPLKKKISSWLINHKLRYPSLIWQQKICFCFDFASYTNSSFFLQISLEVAQWAALICHNQPIWYSFTNRANSMCRHCNMGTWVP